MNRFKTLIVLFLVMCFAFSLSACSGRETEYESIRAFEFHFYPEEYEEEYSEAAKTLLLEADIDYQLRIDASCESGTMKICVKYADEDAEEYTVNAAMSCHKLLSIPAKTARELSVIVSIDPDTKGDVLSELLASRK